MRTPARDTALPDTYVEETTATQLENMCHRGAGYTTLFGQPFSAEPVRTLQARDPGFRWQHAACSGATTQHVWQTAQYPGPDHLEKVQNIQLEYVASNTDFIALTIGGNDLGFASIVKWCEGWFCGVPSDEKFGSVKDKVSETLRQIHAKAPSATVFLLGYPRPFVDDPQNTCGDIFLGESRWGISTTEQRNMNATVDRLNTILAEAAAEQGVHFVNVSFRGHELCTGGTRFLWGDRAPESIPVWRNGRYHPTIEGQKQYDRDLRTYIDAQLKLPGMRDPRGFLLNPTPRAAVAARFASGGPVESYGPARVERLYAGGCAPASVLLPGEELSVTGSGFAPGSIVTVSVGAGDDTTPVATVPADENGVAHTLIDAPDLPPTETGLLMEGINSTGGLHRAVAILEVGASYGIDTDQDGVDDVCDLCPGTPDPAQIDSDGDGRGDACDTCPDDARDDADGDGICVPADPCPLDPENDADLDGVCGDVDDCPGIADPLQGDLDRDGTGDLCDPCTDTDRDGFGDPGFLNPGCSIDNCPTAMNPDQLDTDGDGFGDACDNAPHVPNPDQADHDRDGAGDAEDCAPYDAGMSAPPNEIALAPFVNDRVLRWVRDAPGASAVYDVTRGSLAELPVGSGVGEVCLLGATASTECIDPELPSAGAGFYYLVRGRNACTDGSWGNTSTGRPRPVTACR